MMEARKLDTANPFKEAREKSDELESKLTSETMNLTHSGLEDLLATEGRELLRRLLQGHLELGHVKEERAWSAATVTDELTGGVVHGSC